MWRCDCYTVYCVTITLTVWLVVTCGFGRCPIACSHGPSKESPWSLRLAVAHRRYHPVVLGKRAQQTIKSATAPVLEWLLYWQCIVRYRATSEHSVAACGTRQTLERPFGLTVACRPRLRSALIGWPALVDPLLLCSGFIIAGIDCVSAPCPLCTCPGTKLSD